MVIDIQIRGLSLTPAMKSLVEQRMSFVLARYGDRINRINVVLQSINDPKGGIDKRCCIHLNLQGSSAIVIEEINDDLYEAVMSCGSRLRHLWAEDRAD